MPGQQNIKKSGGHWLAAQWHCRVTVCQCLCLFIFWFVY